MGAGSGGDHSGESLVVVSAGGILAFDDVVRDVMSAAMVDASASTLEFPAPRGGSAILSVREGGDATF